MADTVLMGDVDKVLRATPDVRWYETSRFAGRFGSRVRIRM